MRLQLLIGATMIVTFTQCTKVPQIEEDKSDLHFYAIGIDDKCKVVVHQSIDSIAESLLQNDLPIDTTEMTCFTPPVVIPSSEVKK